MKRLCCYKLQAHLLQRVSDDAVQCFTATIFMYVMLDMFTPHM